MNSLTIVKRAGKTVWGWWMAFARALGFVNTMILLTVVYLVVVGPMSIIMRVLGKDPLTHRKSPESFWKPKDPVSNTINQARRQF